MKETRFHQLVHRLRSFSLGVLPLLLPIVIGIFLLVPETSGAELFAPPAAGPDLRANPVIVAGENEFLVLWSDRRSTLGYEVWGNVISIEGMVAEPYGFEVMGYPLDSYQPIADGRSAREALVLAAGTQAKAVLREGTVENLSPSPTVPWFLGKLVAVPSGYILLHGYRETLASRLDVDGNPTGVSRSLSQSYFVDATRSPSELAALVYRDGILRIVISDLELSSVAEIEISDDVGIVESDSNRISPHGASIAASQGGFVVTWIARDHRRIMSTRVSGGAAADPKLVHEQIEQIGSITSSPFSDGSVLAAWTQWFSAATIGATRLTPAGQPITEPATIFDVAPTQNGIHSLSSATIGQRALLAFNVDDDLTALLLDETLTRLSLVDPALTPASQLRPDAAAVEHDRAIVVWEENLLQGNRIRLQTVANGVPEPGMARMPWPDREQARPLIAAGKSTSLIAARGANNLLEAGLIDNISLAPLREPVTLGKLVLADLFDVSARPDGFSVAAVVEDENFKVQLELANFDLAGNLIDLETRAFPGTISSAIFRTSLALECTDEECLLAWRETVSQGRMVWNHTLKLSRFDLQLNGITTETVASSLASLDDVSMACNAETCILVWTETSQGFSTVRGLGLARSDRSGIQTFTVAEAARDASVARMDEGFIVSWSIVSGYPYEETPPGFVAARALDRRADGSFRLMPVWILPQPPNLPQWSPVPVAVSTGRHLVYVTLDGDDEGGPRIAIEELPVRSRTRAIRYRL